MAKKKAKKKASKKAVKKKVRASGRAGASKSKARKTAKKAVKKKSPSRKAAPKPAVKAKRKAPAGKKKQIVGEGDYAATRAFDRDQAAFVKKNKAKIPAMGKAAKAALEGPEGASLRAAEAKAAAHAAPDAENDPAPGAWVIPPG